MSHRRTAWRQMLTLIVHVALAAVFAPACPSEASENGGAAWLHRLLDRVDRALTARCLTPAAGTAMSEAIAAGAARPILGSDWTLKGGKLGGDRIDIEIEDEAHHVYGLTLALPGAQMGEPVERGERFGFYPDSTTATNPRAAAALLALARTFDAAIPDSALARCGGPEREDRRYSRRIALASALVEALIVLVAIVYSLRTIAKAGIDP